MLCPHSQFIAESGGYVKPVTFEEVPDIVHQSLHFTKIENLPFASQ